MTNHYYHRINANSSERFVEAQIDDFDADAADHDAHVRSLLTHRRAKPHGKWGDGDENLVVEIAKFTFWCDDGKLRELTIFIDEDGQRKSLFPNHRANALIDAGRFTPKNRLKFKEGKINVSTQKCSKSTSNPSF